MKCPLGATLNSAYVSTVVKLHFWFVLSGSVNRDLLEHLPFRILEGGVEDFIEQNLSFIRSSELAEHTGGVEV